jgi:hypothetical protein
LPLNNALLLIVPTNTIIVIAEISTLHISQEFFIVSDDNELEVGLRLSGADDAVERFCKTANIVAVEVSGRLIQCYELQKTVSSCCFL